MKYYTGIGSRSASYNILNQMEEIAYWLAENRFILRSGGANGADTAFEDGATAYCNETHHDKYKYMEIYLPWKEFNFNKSLLFNIPQKAFKIAEEIHPNWKACKLGARKLHARNVQQVLGRDLNTPSSFLLCWSEPQGNSISGGTRTAYELARQHNIPVYNMYDKEREETMEWIRETIRNIN